MNVLQRRLHSLKMGTTAVPLTPDDYRFSITMVPSYTLPVELVDRTMPCAAPPRII